MIRSAPVAIVLCLQACLLFFALDLLPVWTDELFTLRTVAHPVHEIISIVRQDVHPPLYFVLLHHWRNLPLPWNGIAALRAFSVLWALLATFLLDRFWTHSLKPFERWLALSLFAFSPCLLLYGRMARSYSMQTALALLALGLLQRSMRNPRSAMLSGGALASILALLYTHYVPGVALLAGFVLIGCRSVGTIRMVAFSFAVALGYLPWAITLLDAIRRWGEATGFASAYTLSGNALLEHFLKIAFGLVSLTIGESFVGLSLVLVPLILLLAATGARTPEFSRQFLAMIAIAAVVGYLGVSRWASYPFVAARLLWLLPFLSLSIALAISRMNSLSVRRGVMLAILLSYASSSAMYFRRTNFLNHGYSVPLPEIAATLNREAQPGDLILIDAYNTDDAVLVYYLSGRTPYITLTDSGVPVARRGIGSAATVWIVRNTRDVSPGHITASVRNDACTGRQQRTTLLEPYAAWQQSAMKIAGFRPPMTHFYQLTACGPAATPGPKSLKTL